MTITSNTVYFHSFQVSLSPSTRGVSHVISTLFLPPHPLGCSGAQLSFWQPLISDTSQRHSIFRADASSSAKSTFPPLRCFQCRMCSVLHLAKSRVLRCKFAAGVLFSVTRAQGVQCIPVVRSTVCPANIDLTSGMTVAFSIRIPILFHKKWTSHLHSLTLQVRCTVLQQ